MELLARHGQLSATEIAARFSVSPPAISQHLKILRETDVVEVEKRAQQRIYRLKPDAMLEVEEWAQQYRLKWSKRFEALDRVLKRQMEQRLGNPNENPNEGKEQEDDERI